MQGWLEPLRDTRVCAGVITVLTLLKLGTGSAEESKAWFLYITRQAVVCEKFLVHHLAASGGVQKFFDYEALHEVRLRKFAVLRG